MIVIYFTCKQYKELYIYFFIYQRQWCNGNMKPFQGFASGSIPD